MSTANPVQPSNNKPGLIRRTLERHRLGIFAVAVFGTVAAYVAISMFAHPLYKSYSILRIEPASTGLYQVHTNDETFEAFLQTQVNLITSPNVLTATATHPKVSNLERIKNSKDVVQELNKVVRVNVTPGTYLIEVSMMSSDSNESATIVNAVVDAYFSANEEWANSVTRNQIKNLEDYLRNLRAQTEEIERQWKEIAASGEVERLMLPRPKDANDADRPLRVTVEQFMQLKKELFQIHLELVQNQAWAKDLKDSAKRATTERPEATEKLIDSRFRTDPEVVALAEQMKEAQEKVEKAKKIVQDPDDPGVQAAKKKLDALKEKYSQLWETKSKAWREEFELTTVNQAAEQELRQTEAKVRELQVKEAALKAEAEKLDIVNAKNVIDDVKIKLLLEQRASTKSMEEVVQRRLEQLRFEARGETRVRKVNEAFASNKPIINDHKNLLMTASPFVMLFVSFSLFLVVEAVGGPRRKVVDAASETGPDEPGSPLQV